MSTEVSGYRIDKRSGQRGVVTTKDPAREAATKEEKDLLPIEWVKKR